MGATLVSLLRLRVPTCCVCVRKEGVIRADESFFGNRTSDFGAWREATRRALCQQKAHSIQVFGELFGGRHPNDEMCGEKKRPCVQGSGVFYSRWQHFVVFDVLINGARFLDFDVHLNLNQMRCSVPFGHQTTLSADDFRTAS
jgi:hypothetical protein